MNEQAKPPLWKTLVVAMAFFLVGVFTATTLNQYKPDQMQAYYGQQIMKLQSDCSARGTQFNLMVMCLPSGVLNTSGINFTNNLTAIGVRP